MSLVSSIGTAPPRKIVAYLAHPVSAPTREGIEANLANCRAWLRWLVEHTEWAVSCPWMPYVETLDEATHRDRGIADDLAMLERHDLIVLTGGRVSSGMATEWDHAIERGLAVVDLATGSQPLPPVKPGLAHVAALLVVRQADRELLGRAARDRLGETRR